MHFANVWTPNRKDYNASTEYKPDLEIHSRCNTGSELRNAGSSAGRTSFF